VSPIHVAKTTIYWRQPVTSIPHDGRHRVNRPPKAQSRSPPRSYPDSTIPPAPKCGREGPGFPGDRAQPNLAYRAAATTFDPERERCDCPDRARPAHRERINLGRIDIRLGDTVKRPIEQAASIDDKTVSAFIT